MTITTIDLLNYLRCRRYAALDTKTVSRQLNGILIDEKYSSIKYLSVKKNYQSIITEEDPEEASQKMQMHHEVTAKAVSEIKKEAFGTIQTLFPDCLISHAQRLTYNFTEDLAVSVRVDYLCSYSDNLYAFTVLPMTDRELVNWKYNLGKEKISFFSKNEQGIFSHKKTSLSPAVRSNYSERLEKMKDRHSEIGRFLYDLAVKTFVLKKLYPHQKIGAYLILLNHQYVQKENVPLEKRPDLISFFDLSDIVGEYANQIDVDLYRIMNHISLNDDTPCLLVKNECQRGGAFECQFADYCFSHIPKKNSIFHYFMNHMGFAEGPAKTDPCHDTYELINEGMVDMLDVPISWLQREKNLMQRYCVENDYTFVNKPKVKAILETLKYPLYFLDFEAFPSVIPRFRGESPYSQSVFQFSIHVQKDATPISKDDPATHFEYLITDENDHREELIQKLIEYIPDGDSSIIVYNKAFEQNRLLELADIFPKYKEPLLKLASRLFDLLRVLKNDYDFYISRGFSKVAADSFNFYHPDLCGSYSLKKVLPVFDSKGYDQMPIADGMTAYLQYARFPEMEHFEKQKTIENLLSYCKQDTYSMVVILDGIRQLL